ncbi:MAG: YdeI/OmpD-associated family protein [Pseudomonadota bacterium]
MNDYIAFDGVVEPLVWGDKTFLVLALPEAVLADLPQGTRRIEGEFAEHPINMALTRAPVTPATFVYTGAAFLKEAGITPGEVFEARIRAADPGTVEVPGDVMAALRGAGRSADWHALTPGKRRALLHTVASAKRAETRAKRIAALIKALP